MWKSRVVIDLSGLNTDIASAGIPTDTLKEISKAANDAANDTTALTVILTDGDVTFDAAALAAITGQATGSEVRLCLDSIPETRLRLAQREAVEDLDVLSVYDAYLVNGNTRIRDFQGGSVTVTVPYTLKEGQRAEGLAVWYVADSGGKSEVPATYSNRLVTFTVTHFSNHTTPPA